MPVYRATWIAPADHHESTAIVVAESQAVALSHLQGFMGSHGADELGDCQLVDLELLPPGVHFYESGDCR